MTRQEWNFSMLRDDLNPLNSPAERERREVAADDADLKATIEAAAGVFRREVLLTDEADHAWWPGSVWDVENE